MNPLSSTKSPSFEIAHALTEDGSAAAHLLVDQLTEHGVASSVESLTQVLGTVVAEPARGFLLVARVNGQIVGVAYVATILSAEHYGTVAWLEELYVLPKYRGHGIGSALIETVVNRARESGAVAVDLEVDEAHAGVAELYERLGFRRLKRSRWVRALVE